MHYGLLKIMTNRTKFLTLGIALGLHLTLSACSPSMFWSSDDEDIKNMSPPRKINTACANLVLSDYGLDVTTTRKLMHCFNAEGALDPLDKLVQSLSDSQLTPIVNLANNHLIGNPKLLYQYDQSFKQLEKSKLLDHLFAQLGRLIENDEFIAAAIAVLKENYYKPDRPRSDLLSISNLNQKSETNRQLLEALKIAADEITPERVALVLDALLIFSEAKSLLELERKMVYTLGDSPQATLSKIISQFLKYLRETSDPEHVDVGKTLIQALTSGPLLSKIDLLLGRTESEIRDRLQETSVLTQALIGNNGKTLDDLSTLAHYGKKTMSCLEGATTLPNPMNFLIKELISQDPQQLGSFLYQGTLLKLSSVNSFCALPQEVGKHYPVIAQLAQTTAITPLSNWLKVLDQNPSQLSLVLDILADTGSGKGKGPNITPENEGGIKYLLPLLAELNHRNVWDELLLLLTLLDDSLRNHAMNLLHWSIQPQASLEEQKSVYDVLSEVLSQNSTLSLVRFLVALKPYLESDESFIAPALKIFRSAYYINDVHPMLDLTQTLMREAPNSESLLTTLFEISEMPQFREALKFASTMAKDGRMKELLIASLNLFQKVSASGVTPIHLTAEPPFASFARHSLSSSDLRPYKFGPTPVQAPPACQKIDLNFQLKNVTDPRFNEQLGFLLACKNNDGTHDWLTHPIEYLNQEKAENGSSYLQLAFDSLKTLPITPPETAFLIRTWTQFYDQGGFTNALRGIPFWVDSLSDFSQPVLRPLLQLAAPLLSHEKARTALTRIRHTLAQELHSDDLPKIFSWLDPLLDQKPEPTPRTDPDPINIEKLADLVQSRECINNRELALKKAAEIDSDYREAITSWDQVQGRPRRSFTDTEFDARLAPLFTKLDRPEVRQALLNFLQHPAFEPQWLGSQSGPSLKNWLWDRSKDMQVIYYLYPGELTPRLRIVNSLDRLELVLINSDFPAPVLKKNFALYFLALIGNAWGDEPRKNWPQDIQDQFPENKKDRPLTLREAVQQINKTQRMAEFLFGLIEDPPCNSALNIHSQSTATTTTNDSLGALSLDQSDETLSQRKETKRVLYNIHQVLSVLEENLPDSPHLHAGGLKIIRNLMHDVYYSTPEKYRSPKAAWNNNLSVVTHLARLGIFRQAGQHIRYLPKNDYQLNSFFMGFMTAATSPATPQLLSVFFQDPKHTLLWNTFHTLYGMINAAENRDLHPQYQVQLQDKTKSQMQATHHEWTLQWERLKQFSFYSFALAYEMGWIYHASSDIQTALQEQIQYLSTHPHTVEKALRSPLPYYLTRTVFDEHENDETKALFAQHIQNILEKTRLIPDALEIFSTLDQSPLAQNSWDQFAQLKNQLLALPEYKALGLETLLTDIKNFFKEENSESIANQTARTLRHHLASRLEQGDLEQWLLLIARNPEKAYTILDALSQSIKTNELQDFSGFIRRGLSRSH